MPKVKVKLKVISIFGKKELEYELEGSQEEIITLAKKLVDGVSV